MKNYELTSDMKKETYQAPQAENVAIAMGGAGILSLSLSDDGQIPVLVEEEEDWAESMWR